MGFVKQVDLEAQNIFEERATNILNELEEEIENLIDTSNVRTYKSQEAVFCAIERLYTVYQLIQTEFWSKELE